MATLRDFKDFVLRETNCTYTRHFPFEWVAREIAGSSKFDARIAFWDKLCQIGEQNTHLIKTVGDIETTVELTNNEWQELEKEFRSLI